MAFDKIKEAQPKVVKLLENSIKMNRLSHAYLFEGEAGTKKFETAIYFAQLLLCKNEEKPCGICSNCKRIKNMIHPNVYIVEPDNNIIRKKQIVELQNEFLRDYCEKNGIVLEAYAPLMSWKVKELLENEILISIAAKYNKTVPQIAAKIK